MFNVVLQDAGTEMERGMRKMQEEGNKVGYSIKPLDQDLMALKKGRKQVGVWKTEIMMQI